MKRILRYIFLVLALLVSTLTYAQINRWQDLYKVKKKDTLFGIARKYSISIPELMEANPEMKVEGYQLKKGDTLFIPFPRAEVKPAPKPQQQVKTLGSTLKVGIMLPLHDVDGDGRRMVEYYRGFLMACEDLKRQGLSLDIHAWNVPIDADIRQTLLSQGAKDCHMIFGPLYTHQVKPLADFCRAYDIKLVIPFSINGNEVMKNPQVFQVYQSESNLTNDAINAFLERFPKSHPIFIDCNDSTSRKGAFTFGLRSKLEQRGIRYSITNLKSSESMFAKAFSRQKPNVVILNTGRSPQLNVAFAKLESLVANYPQLKVSMYGYTEWLMYSHNLNNFFKFDTYIPTTFYYNPLDKRVQAFERRYRNWFHQDMRYALPRFAITGYDQATFFLLGLHRYGRKFVGSKAQPVTKPLQTAFYFSKYKGGGMQNEHFELIHYKPNQGIESITY